MIREANHAFGFAEIMISRSMLASGNHAGSAHIMTSHRHYDAKHVMVLP
jgi:hypothetical protein